MAEVTTRNETRAALYCGITSLAVLAFLPAMMELLSGLLQWTDRVVGRFATADLSGLVIGTLLAAGSAGRFTARTVVGLGAGILLLANLLSVLSPVPWLLITLRVGGGIGAGLMLGTCYALYARGTPIRNFALFQAGQQSLSVAAPLVLPVVANVWGWQACFLLLAALTAPALILARILPNEPWAVPQEQASSSSDHSTPVVWLAVAGTVIWWAGQGAIWTYVGLIGSSAGIPSHDVQFSLSLAAFCGLPAVIVPLLIGTRFGTYTPLFVAFGITITALFGLAVAATLVPYRIAACAYLGVWGVFAAYQFSAIVSVDQGGPATRTLPSASYSGMLIGPLIASELATAGGYGWVISMTIVTNLAGLAALLPLAPYLARGSASQNTSQELRKSVRQGSVDA